MGITKGLILNLLGLTIMIVMLVILMISLPVIFFIHVACCAWEYICFLLLIKYKEAFINDTGLKQTFYILDRKEDELCVVLN